jgi:hypothetical protein
MTIGYPPRAATPPVGQVASVSRAERRREATASGPPRPVRVHVTDTLALTSWADSHVDPDH